MSISAGFRAAIKQVAERVINLTESITGRRIGYALGAAMAAVTVAPHTGFAQNNSTYAEKDLNPYVSQCGAGRLSAEQVKTVVAYWQQKAAAAGVVLDPAYAEKLGIYVSQYGADQLTPEQVVVFASRYGLEKLGDKKIQDTAMHWQQKAAASSVGTGNVARGNQQPYASQENLSNAGSTLASQAPATVQVVPQTTQLALVGASVNLLDPNARPAPQAAAATSSAAQANGVAATGNADAAFYGQQLNAKPFVDYYMMNGVGALNNEQQKIVANALAERERQDKWLQPYLQKVVFCNAWGGGGFPTSVGQLSQIQVATRTGAEVETLTPWAFLTVWNPKEKCWVSDDHSTSGTLVPFQQVVVGAIKSIFESDEDKKAADHYRGLFENEPFLGGALSYVAPWIWGCHEAGYDECQTINSTPFNPAFLPRKGSTNNITCMTNSYSNADKDHEGGRPDCSAVEYVPLLNHFTIPADPAALQGVYDMLKKAYADARQRAVRLAALNGKVPQGMAVSATAKIDTLVRNPVLVSAQISSSDATTCATKTDGDPRHYLSYLNSYEECVKLNFPGQPGLLHQAEANRQTYLAQHPAQNLNANVQTDVPPPQYAAAPTVKARSTAAAKAKAARFLADYNAAGSRVERQQHAQNLDAFRAAYKTQAQAQQARTKARREARHHAAPSPAA